MTHDILARLGAQRREQDAAEAAVIAMPEVALTTEHETAILTAVLTETRPRAPRVLRRRTLPLAAVTLAAAAAVLVIPWGERPPEETIRETRSERGIVQPEYEVWVSGGSRGGRGDEEVATFRPGQQIRVEAVPERPFAGAQELRVIGIHHGVEHRLRWPSRSPAPEKGIFTVEGPVEDLARAGTGRWSLRVELAGPAHGPGFVLAARAIEVLAD